MILIAELLGWRLRQRHNVLLEPGAPGWPRNDCLQHWWECWEEYLGEQVVWLHFEDCDGHFVLLFTAAERQRAKRAGPELACLRTRRRGLGHGLDAMSSGQTRA
ncbi:MAG: hypothetical protein C4345_07275 [Chloroflexota bacterium]